MKHSMKLAAFALALVYGNASAQEVGARLNLVCMGAGSANRPNNTYVYGADNNGNSAWANSVGNRSVPFDDQVNIWIEGAEGRVRMPRTMLPPVHGGDGGWFEINMLISAES